MGNAMLGVAPRFRDDPLTVDTGAGSPPLVDMGVYEYHPDCNGNGTRRRRIGPRDELIWLRCYRAYTGRPHAGPPNPV